jgi:hypothetical protein
MPKPYQEIILHAGLPKTGSTSIQNNCFRYREILRENGICYPVFTLGERKLVNHSDPITAAMSDAPNKRQWAYRQQVMAREAEAREDLRRQFRRLFARPEVERLLISAEIVSNYSDADACELRDFLSARADRLRVVAFLRSPQSSVESILQQQAYGGGVEENVEGAVCAVKERFELLYRVFGENLEVRNFHAAVDAPGGLVAEFLRLLPIPGARLDAMEFASSNERISMEAYRLMVAINRRYPLVPAGGSGYQRRFHDLRPLAQLPGSPFRIERFRESQWYQTACREAAELERDYGFSFPEVPDREAQPLWQERTLLVLEDAICRLESEELRHAAADFLEQEAHSPDVAGQAAATLLGFVARRVRAGENPPIQNLLDEIGADYFKFAALQLGQESPRLALQLMSIAHALRPEAQFIAERIEHYRDRLKGA